MMFGYSYSLWNATHTSNLSNNLSIGCFSIDFTESGSNINLTNAYPISDAKGLTKTPYTFTITNSGTIDSYYTISNEEDTNNTLDTTYLKYKLVSNDGYDSGVKRLKDIGTGTYRIGDERALQKSKNVTYKLYL